MIESLPPEIQLHIDMTADQAVSDKHIARWLDRGYADVNIYLVLLKKTLLLLVYLYHILVFGENNYCIHMHAGMLVNHQLDKGQ